MVRDCWPGIIGAACPKLPLGILVRCLCAELESELMSRVFFFCEDAKSSVLLKNSMDLGLHGFRMACVWRQQRSR
jgi:hypothetical protein